MSRRAASPLLCALLVAGAAEAYKPPLPQGWVTDTAGKLSPEDRAFLDARLRAFEKENGAQVFVFIPKSLEGEPIEDVAYTTFR
ncbi:MAG TPA: TPM domain-containing protein, partial [Myxococcaceae bacterium]|nr:TPM domain-containing protein [Myxococcaceae bacterium]